MALITEHLYQAGQLIRRNQAISLVGLMTMVYLPLSFLYQPITKEPLTTINVIRLALIAVLFMVICFRSYPLPYLLHKMTAIVVPASAVFFTSFILINPSLFNDIALEDGLIEELSFLFLACAAMIMAIASYTFRRNRDNQMAFLTIVGSLVLFVLSMEEVSWFQRFFNIESSSFFIEYNSQHETNLHNLNTLLANKMYFALAFVLLVILPYFKDIWCRLLNYMHLSRFTQLIPSSWATVPFLLMAPLATWQFFNFTEPTYFVIWIGSFIILLALIIKYWKNQRRRSIYLVGFSLLYVFLTILVHSLNYQGLGIRYAVFSEYREFYIAWGLTAYATFVLYQARIARPNRVNLLIKSNKV